MQYRLIVFDWDGTLMDSTAHIVKAVQATCRELGWPVPEPDLARSVIGLGLREAVAGVMPDIDDAAYAQFVESYRRWYLSPELNVSDLFPGARAVLEHLDREGRLLGVATGKGRAGLDRVLRETALGRLIAASRCADEAFSKPHPQMLLDVMDFAGAEARETLMIGDTTFDLDMARNAGVDAVGVLSGAHPPERLEASGPRILLPDVNALPDWLNETGG